ncbi:hypothetical protein ACQR3P_08840 [Rhodococcus sp. IEGM1300]
MLAFVPASLLFLQITGFPSKPEYREINQASFAGLSANERMKIYVLKAEGEVVGALMYRLANR